MRIRTEQKYRRANKDFFRDKVGQSLYAGCPALCHGEVALYERVLSGAEIYKLYRDGAPDFDPAIERELKHKFDGTELEEFTFKPDAKWTKQIDCDSQKPVEQIKEYYIQGHAEAIKPEGSKEGLLIETPDIPYGWDAYPKQVYIARVPLAGFVVKTQSHNDVIAYRNQWMLSE